MDMFQLNREIAYKGRIGRERRDFCINYIQQKKEVLKRIEQEVLDVSEREGLGFTCRKGCSFCCVLYVEGNIKECEAIVYFLYQNDDALNIFLNQYPIWRQKTGQYGDLLLSCQKDFGQLRKDNEDKAAQQELVDDLLFYKLLNVPCPFLHDNICVIYEVRPYTCATHYVTSPAEFCSPLNPYDPVVYRTEPSGDILDLSFYHRSIQEPVISCLPLTVYEILNDGFSYLATVTGLQNLEEESLNDPEVKAFLLNHGKTQGKLC